MKGGDESNGEDENTRLLLLPVRQTTHNPNLTSLILTQNSLCILSGPFLCALCLLCVHPRLEGRNMLAVLTWIFAWWLTDAVPMPVTSMSPLFLFPIFGISNADDVARSYMDDVIALVLGSFILALAVQHYNIHWRLALNITLLFCGEPLNPRMLLMGICATSAFVSMWLHNVAVAVMMMPVATGILHRFPGSPHRNSEVDKYSRAVVLGVVYAVAIGGMSTLTGTGVNLILVGMWKAYYPQAQLITFNTWLVFGLPVALLMLVALWVLLCLLYCSQSSGPTLSPYLDKAHLRAELGLIGPMSFEEKAILSVFSVLIALWMTRSLTGDIPGWGGLFQGRVGDGTVSVMMSTFLFIIPDKKRRGQKLMNWEKCRSLPWNIILLLGAGLAIADGVRSSGLANVLSGTLKFLEHVPFWALAPIVCVVSGTLTELISSNNAVALLLSPLLVQISQTIHVHPLVLMVPGAVGAQFAYLLPTATPSNTVGFGTGHIEIKDMIKIGLPIKAIGTVVVSLLMPTLGAYVFGTHEAV